ncbi:glutathione S-transferase family protein [Hydrogenophaga sp. PBL-H3]|uniref:glutathione S-transferase family protein n=1 Tax=Hydrogenophaga sp. PBL-H3 TaxID=434010 RepID=UPI0013200169|nr:glutathione S-transferase family protein [Hydrogenophaga sp. PBL-H3]QHE77960.1 glutathione S-transferase family protein [Hydrogenophaga sp. PBL-H3]QHE82384.1 glutathione S-transferase family protein [Hydrogenophaga sp. PBL-H3]
MKLFVAPRAPNPRRVQMFLVEKNITGLELVNIDLNAQEHKQAAYLAKSPLARVPALELDDGRVLTETRAICTWLEGMHPEPNLMGRDAQERAFIEMADRRMEWYLMLPLANAIRHTHPGLAPLEQPQFPDFGQSQLAKATDTAVWLDGELQRQPWVAGDRFTIADITAFCTVEFGKLMRFKPADAGLHALQAWRDKVAARPSAGA